MRNGKGFAVTLISSVCRLGWRLQLLALVPALAWSQVSMVHVTECQPQAFPATCTISSPGPGHVIVVGFQMSGDIATTITSITDNSGNIYAEAGAARATDTGGMVADLWYAKNSVAGAS